MRQLQSTVSLTSLGLCAKEGPAFPSGPIAPAKGIHNQSQLHPSHSQRASPGSEEHQPASQPPPFTPSLCQIILPIVKWKQPPTSCLHVDKMRKSPVGEMALCIVYRKARRVGWVGRSSHQCIQPYRERRLQLSQASSYGGIVIN